MPHLATAARAACMLLVLLDACGGAARPAEGVDPFDLQGDGGPHKKRVSYDDPGEAHDPATLAPLFDDLDRPKFPAATQSERDCWQGVEVFGDARKDYAALVARCGTPTGAVPYVNPSYGRLHHEYDARDTYIVHVQKGLCYRFMGVADGTIHKMDILIERDGALVGSDSTQGPFVIIDTDKAWCMDAEGDYQFALTLGDSGEGHYVFGVWARPGPPPPAPAPPAKATGPSKKKKPSRR